MRNYSVLVVDDEVPFLNSIRRCFNAEGFQRLVFLSDPVEAAKIILSEASFDLCLFDADAAGLDGMDAHGVFPCKGLRSASADVAEMGVAEA